MDLDFTAHIQGRWERHCQLASAIIIGYEYLLQFHGEVDYFWRKKWNFSKILFLWSRYYSIGFTIGNAYVFMQESPTEEFCMDFFHWQNTGATLQYITTQVILQLRLYAMYGNSKKMLTFLVALTAAEIAAMGCLFGIPREGLVGTNNPSPGLFLCADADPPDFHWMAWVPTVTLITESIFLGLALYKAWENSRSGTGGRILPWLARESVFYFFAIFWVHLGNLIIWMVNKVTLNELVTGFSFAIPAVLANRLLLSIRSKNLDVYPPGETELSKQSRLSWRAPPSSTSRTFDISTIGMTTTTGTGYTGACSTGDESAQPMSGSSNSGTAVDDDSSERVSNKVQV